MASPPGAPTIGTDGVSSAICCRRARACRARRAGSTDMCALRPAWRARRYLLARWARARACSEALASDCSSGDLFSVVLVSPRG